MVFGVIIYVDSYLYTTRVFATPLYMGVGGIRFPISKNATRSDRDPINYPIN
jgi:hypothetical protein